MTTSILPLLFLASVVAGSGTDVTNNLFSDIGPLLALFGENFAQQFLRESFTWLDHIIFAMAPLGIITAIVGAIRVGGPPWLKAVIGRARENRSSAELEFMSSTSHEVCELWNGEGIIRTTGKGIVKQIVYLDGCGDPEKECCLFTLTEAEKKEHMKKEVYRGPLIKRFFHRQKDPNSYEDRPDRAPNISLNLHSKQATWELVAVAASGIILQSGVLVFSGFVAYNSRFGNRVGGPPSPYAYPVLFAGTVTLALGMWISALVIGESTEEFEWEAIPKVPKVPKPHPGDLDSSEKGLETPNPEKIAEPEIAKPNFRVFWLQKGFFVSDQSFDSFMLMAKGEKEIILTSCRNNDPVSHEEAQKTGKTEGPTDISVSLNILCIIGTFASVSGFVLQFEGFRGISWACSIAQLVAIMIMTVLRAAVRRGMLDSPATRKITPEYEMDWLSLKLGFDDGYLTSLSDQPKNPCPQCGLAKSDPIHKATPFPTCKPPPAPERPFWKICNELSYPPSAELIESQEKSDDGKSGTSIVSGRESSMDSARRRPGYPLSNAPSSSAPKKREQLKVQEREDAAKEQEKNDSLQVQAIVNIRKRLGELTEWKTEKPPYAAYIAKAIGKVMDLFEWGDKTTFIWCMDVQITGDKSKPKQPGKLRFVANKGTQSESSWTTPEKDIEALLSLWMYHFKDKNQRDDEPRGTPSALENSDPITPPLRRVLGPATDVLKTDLAWWAGEGVAEALELFKWDKSDKSLSLGYGRQKDRKPREAGTPSSCWAMVTNLSSEAIERFLAQHIFSAFMWAIADHIPVPQIESSTTVDLQSQNKFNPEVPKWTSLRLVNQTIQDMAKAVEGAALGTLEDAYTLIIPPLSLANKLPSEGLVEMVRQKAIENHQDYQLDKAYDLYLQLLTLCDNSLLLNEKFVYKAVATAVDFLITTTSVTVTDEGEAGDNEPQLRGAKAALIKQLKSKNLEPISISLKELFKKQKRHELYDSMLSAKEDEGGPQEDAKKTTKKDIRPKQAYGTKFGYTTLHNQIIWTKGNVDIDSWKYLEAPDILGWTPLHYAVFYAPGIVSRILKEERVLASRPDLAGRTPLHYAVMNKSPDASDLVGELLKAYGRAESGSDGILPLHLAAKCGNEDAAKALLESPLHREKMSAGDYWGMTPLHFAAIEGEVDIVKLLLTREARINAQDKFERTALHLAVEKIKADVVEELLKGDDASKVTKVKDKNGKTALQLAAELERSVDDKLTKANSDKGSVEQKKKKEESSKKPTDGKVPDGGKVDGKVDEAAALDGGGIRRTSKAGAEAIYDADEVEKNELPGKEKHVDADTQKGSQKKVPNKAAKTEEKTNKEKLSKELEKLKRTIQRLSKESEDLKKMIELLLGKEDLVVDGGKLLLWAAKERLNTTFSLLMSKRVKDDEIDASTGQSVLHFAAMVGSEGMVHQLLDKWASEEASSAATVGESLKEKMDNATDATGTTPLLVAASPSATAGESLKEKRVNATDSTGMTALILAAIGGYAIGGYSKIVDFLLDAGANQTVVDQDKRTALSWAVEKGQVAIVKRLLDSDNIACMNPNAVDGDPPRLLLARAAENGNLNMAKLLSGKGAKLDSKGISDHTPICWAVVNGHKDIVEFFLQAKPKPDVDEIDEISDLTLLSEAVNADQLEIAKQLLDAEADFKKQSGRYQQTPLSFAASLGRTSFVELLLKYRADTEEVDKDGWTPLMFAACGNYPETVKLLISKNARVSLSTDGEKSALSLAIDRDSDEMVSEVLENARGEQSKPHLDNAILWAAKRGNTPIVKLLLERGASVNANPRGGSTPLLKAAKRGHVDTVKLLLSRKADVNLANGKGETPLYWASYNGFEDIVNSLLEEREEQKQADPNTPTSSNSTALLAAAVEGHEAVAKRLVGAGAKVNVKNNESETPLYWACSNGNTAMVQTFLDMEAEPNITTTDNSTPLLKAIESGNMKIVELLLDKHAEFDVPNPEVDSALNLASYMGEIEVVRLLLNLDANIKVTDNDGDTPLHQCAHQGNLEIALLLLDVGAELETKNKKGRTPLHYAAWQGRLEIAVLLLAKSVNPDEGDEDGRTPLSLASGGGHDDVVHLLFQSYEARLDSTDNNGRTPISWAAFEGEEATVKLLSTLGADIESEDGDKRTPLSWAASKGNIAAVNVLLVLNAKVESKDNNGRTPLSWAASGGQDYVVKRLLEAKADVVSFDSDGRNPLSWAASLGNEEVAKLLLQHYPDAQIEAQDNEGCTALHHAVEKGNNDVVELILNAEPNLNITDRAQETPLGLAARKDNEEIVVQLLKADANPNVQDESGRTPLFSAIHSDFDSAALQMLEKDVDTEKHPQYSRTPLQEAVCQYSYDIVDKLLTRGADVGGKDIQGRDAIHIAASRGLGGLLELLVDKGLDRNAPVPVMYDKQGRYALHHAACGADKSVVTYLLGKYQDPKQRHQPDNDGWTPLHWAAKAGDEDVVQQFLDIGADANLKENLKGWSPLQIAQFHGHDSVVETLTGNFKIHEIVSSDEVIAPGAVDDSRECDGCSISPICGTVFCCTSCENFDFCFKCKHTSELTHPSHTFVTKEPDHDD